MAPADLDTRAETADRLDAADPLTRFRDEFRIPVQPDGSPQIYLVGNSLGAEPERTPRYLQHELDRWAELGVAGHFVGDTAWEPYHQLLTDQTARLVGAQRDEVTVMNSLTVNLHLLMISFYQPTPGRHKVLIEEHAFPSDHFAVESQIRQRGFDPATSLVTVGPKDGSETIDPNDILGTIDDIGDELAMVLLPGVQYFTGQVLPMRAITKAGHDVGAFVGFDLAHAAGNIVLNLHDWGVDFAAWCGYKYLNGGPGCVAGAYVHERHVTDPDLPKLLGWWGTNHATKFEMETVHDPIPTVESWQVSNTPMLLMVALRASLDIIDEAGGIQALRRKSEQQIAYLDFLVAEVLSERIVSLTPAAMDERGCQSSLRVVSKGVEGRAIYEGLKAAGVACDWRYPDVIRAAPVPLYNSFTDIYRFVRILDDLLTAEGAARAR
ncbi:MAG: kynureninase [Acidimicrobiia bacterium]